MNSPIIITSGEPAGIGLDIIIQLFCDNPDDSTKNALAHIRRPVCVLADQQALAARAAQLGKSVRIHLVTDIENTAQFHKHPNSLNLYHIPCAEAVLAGQLNTANAAQVMQQLSLAAQLALAKKAAAIVTAPVHKAVINDAASTGVLNLAGVGGKFSGHTEFFQQKAAQEDVVMMLANDTLKVALVTTHLPLKDVPAAITTAKLRTVIDILLADMHSKFGKTHPSILVCGLNPHAGEGGHLGEEEIKTINPVLQTYRDKGINISLAMPADTLFSPHNMANTDCFLAMYHDQGLTVLKALGFGETVNITLGLPFVRTSVDHGTALDIAGTGKASPSSLLAALKLADELVG